MNKQYLQVEKMILKQMDNDELPPVIPRNRHQRRAEKKVKK